MLIAAERVESYNPVNIAYGRAYNIREILRTLLEIDDYANARVVYDRSKPAMIPARFIDVRKARSLLGFRAKTTLKDGLKKTIGWYRETQARGRKGRP